MKPLLALIAALMLGSSASAGEFSSATAFGLALTTAVTTPVTLPSAALGLQATATAPNWVFGPLEAGFAGRQISTRLLLWSLPWAGAGLIGLWLATDDAARGFWGMSGAWAVINGGIAVAGLLGAEPALQDLRTVLFVNAGLDVLYIAAGAYLMTRPEATWRGAGLGVLVQGGFLLVFDLLHALLIQG